MNERARREAAQILLSTWGAGQTIEALPESCRPSTLDEGYDVQATLAEQSGRRPVGWKIAATSSAGQKHIGVDGPLAGRLLDNRVHRAPATIVMGPNRMAVAEVEFAFVMARALPSRAAPYAMEEVFAAVASLHPAIEIPDTRYTDVTKAGAAQIAAECACAFEFAYGEAAPESWRGMNLAEHPVALYIDGALAASGIGRNALGDPRIALTWIANELSRQGRGLAAGDVITTGTCIVPAAVARGQALRADYGVLGSIEVRLA